MADMTTHNTIDLIVQAAYKYRFISKPGRTLFGRALIQANAAAVLDSEGDVNPAEYTFTPFARKFKRDAVACAIQHYIEQASEASTWEGSEEQRIVTKVAEKNAVKAGHRPVMTEGYYTDEVDEYGDSEWVPATVHTPAFEVHIEALRSDNGDELPWSDITNEQRDDNSTEYGQSVMVRPIEVIQAEREAERERIMAERTARLESERASERAVEAYTDDEDDDDWPDEGEDV